MGDLIEMKKKEPKAIRFTIGVPAVEYLRIEECGDFYVKEKLVTNDMEIYGAFTEWFAETRKHTAILSQELERLDREATGE